MTYSSGQKFGNENKGRIVREAEAIERFSGEFQIDVGSKFLFQIRML